MDIIQFCDGGDNERLLLGIRGVACRYQEVLPYVGETKAKPQKILGGTPLFKEIHNKNILFCNT